MAPPTAVLFDVDGTLVDTGGAGARSWRYAFNELYGIAADIGSYSNAGMTDPEVAHRTFAATLGREPAQSELARLFATYLLRPIASSPERRRRFGPSSTAGRSSASSRERWRGRPASSSRADA